MAAAVRELQTSEGWQRWVAVRRHNGLSRYSIGNQILIAVACWQRGISPSYVAGYRWWADNGYQVRKGERALRILGPVHRKAEDASGEKRVVVVGFKGVSVFERSQVDAGRDATPLAPEASEPIEGDSHERYLAPVVDRLRAEEIEVEFGPIQIGSARGYFKPDANAIRVDHGLAPNARLRVLLHEGAHALVSVEQKRERSDDEDPPPQLSYAEEECVVETAGHVAASALGLDTSSEAVPYVAGWGESGAFDAVRRAATLIDRIARWLDDAARAGEDDVVVSHVGSTTPLVARTRSGGEA